MPRKEYNKLVRDKIPEIIAKNGGIAKIVAMQDDALFRLALKKKTVEELRELLEAETADAVLEELADVMEVLVALAREFGFSMAAVEAKRWQKRDERGGFDKRLLLEYVDEE